MNSEIFKNDKVAILYDDNTEELTIGYLGDALTEYEVLVLEGIFGRTFADRGEEKDD